MSGTKPKKTEMSNELLGKIFRRSAEKLVELGVESEDDILAAITANAQEAANQGKEKLVVSLGHTLQIDLGRGTQKDTLGWRVSCKAEVVSQLVDPDQEEMDLG